MKFWIILGAVVLGSVSGLAQSFELLDRQDAYTSGVSETLRIPLRIKNNTDKAQFYIFRKVQDDLNSTQKGYFCLDKNCLEADTEEFSKRVEAGETLQNLYFTLETGLLVGQHNIKFEIFPQGTFHQTIEHPVAITIDDRSAKALVFHSKDITIHDVYPNPVTDQASMDYSLHNELVKAKVVIHNILGKSMNDYELPYAENKVKIQADDLPAGVYFYTVYLNNEGVFTRKLIVRK
jgi:hypothetical protein